MKRIECEGVGDNDGFFEIGAEVGVSETACCSTRDEVIDRLRGQLQNCVNYLERAKRHSHRGAYDDAIESANRALYETLGR